MYLPEQNASRHRQRDRCYASGDKERPTDDLCSTWRAPRRPPRLRASGSSGEVARRRRQSASWLETDRRRAVPASRSLAQVVRCPPTPGCADGNSAPHACPSLSSRWARRDASVAPRSAAWCFCAQRGRTSRRRQFRRPVVYLSHHASRRGMGHQVFVPLPVVAGAP